MPKKRGQVTIFLIASLVIILIGTYFFFVQKTELEDIEVLGPEVLPVKNFIDNCISSVAERGILILGLNGGYIDYPEFIERNPRSYLQLGPLSSIKNPYWWYDGIGSVPTEGFIASQIEDYIVSELNSCITGLSAFNLQYDLREVGDLTAKVSLNENDVTVNVNYPIELVNKLNKSTIRLEKFNREIPIRLKKVYEAAKDIMESENRDFFLEFKTIDLITLDEDIPTTDVEITCSEKVWSLNNIGRKLRTLLRVNLPYINIEGSDYNKNIFVSNPFGDDTYEKSYYNSHYVWKVSDKSYEGMRMSFEYDERWPLRIHARPSSNGILKSNSQKTTELLRFLCVNIWHFNYDVEYPVRVAIVDNSPSSLPYQFVFAFRVSVDHNQPNRKNFATAVFETPEIGNEQEFCDDVTNEITAYTVSNATNEVDIADVDLTFTCGAFTCDMGKSEWLSFGAAAGLSKPFPYCVQGILRASKEGFIDREMFIQTGSEKIYTVFMKPLKEFKNYEVVKHDFENPSIERPLANQQATISIKSTNENFESNGFYPDSESFPIKLLNDDSEYELTIYLMENEQIVGGYNGIWKATASELSSASSIKFHVLEKAGNDDERFLFITGLASYSEKVPKPELN